MRHARALAIAAAATLTLTVGVAACGAGAGTGAPAREVAVTATDTECTLASTSLPAGVVKFAVTNTGSKINEFYVFQGDKVLGEVENISPSTTRDLQVELAAGSYQGVCKPGMSGDGITSAFTVTGSAGALGADQLLAAAVARYRQYVQSQTALLVPKTKEFTDAIRANDAVRAKALFPVARSFYETIEPVAESFGDLDRQLDARQDGVEPGAAWTGFHALEQHLWVSGDISRDKPLADQLDTDVNTLNELVKKAEFKPLEIANGAKELLDEVATSKITGEEDRYSHTDLWDFAANVAGVRAAIDALRPALTERAAALLSDVDAKFVVVQTLLDAQRSGDGYKLYPALTPAQIKALADAISGLAEPVSKVAAAITTLAPASLATTTRPGRGSA